MGSDDCPELPRKSFFFVSDHQEGSAACTRAIGSIRRICSDEITPELARQPASYCHLQISNQTWILESMGLTVTVICVAHFIPTLDLVLCVVAKCGLCVEM
jgi:hypothetical protein